MSPLDASSAATLPRLAPRAAIVLPGGRALLVFEEAPDGLPVSGSVEGAGGWTAGFWPQGEGVAGLALLPAMPDEGARLLALDGALAGHLARVGHLEVTAAPLLRLARGAEGAAARILAFLEMHVAVLSPRLVTDFLAGAAQPAGFLELAARPECGGLFLQGWSQAPAEGPVRIIGLETGPTEAEASRFVREDILPPGAGLCLFIKSSGTPIPVPEALFYEAEGRLHRLDAVPGLAVAADGAPATQHVRAMLPRLEAPEPTRAAFRRICRPRYEGRDTLSGFGGPVAAAFDRVLRADDGTLLVTGWLLDPLARVEHVILKSAANLYAPLHKSWNLLPRPDLNQGFGADPRFEGLLDPREVMHGFICHAAAAPEKTAGTLYLEIVLDDGCCLFRPVEATPCHGEGVLPAILAPLSPDGPELRQIVEGHLAPFLQGLAPRGAHLRQRARPLPLGGGLRRGTVDAVIPLGPLTALQPLLAGLAGAPEAAALLLTLVVGRREAAEAARMAGDAFRFYGLAGQLLVVPDHLTLAARIDAGVEAGSAAEVLLWQPSALPQRPGWLAALQGAARRERAALVSPALLYEDGSIHFGGTRLDLDGRAICARAGFGGHTLGAGCEESEVGAAEVALFDRAAFAAAGGLSRHLFGDAFVHLDLARRLRGAGGRVVCARHVGFWMLEETRSEDAAPLARMTRAVDAALLARHALELA